MKRLISLALLLSASGVSAIAVPKSLENKNVVHVQSDDKIFPGWACGYLDLFYAYQRENRGNAQQFEAGVKQVVPSPNGDSDTANLEKIGRVLGLNLQVLYLNKGQATPCTCIPGRGHEKLVDLITEFKSSASGMLHFICAVRNNTHSILISLVKENGDLKMYVHDNTNTAITDGCDVHTFLVQLHEMYANAVIPQQQAPQNNDEEEMMRRILEESRAAAAAHKLQQEQEDDELDRALALSLQENDGGISDPVTLDEEEEEIDELLALEISKYDQ